MVGCQCPGAFEVSGWKFRNRQRRPEVPWASPWLRNPWGPVFQGLEEPRPQGRALGWRWAAGKAWGMELRRRRKGLCRWDFHASQRDVYPGGRGAMDMACSVAESWPQTGGERLRVGPAQDQECLLFSCFEIPSPDLDT